MTEVEKVALAMYETEKATPNYRSYYLPVTREGCFAFVYERMPEESYNIINAVADALYALLPWTPANRKDTK